jgi:hypothetical protein
MQIEPGIVTQVTDIWRQIGYAWDTKIRGDVKIPRSTKQGCRIYAQGLDEV